MRAMILAAGRGERMRPLADSTPKSMLKVNDKPLIQYHIENLVSAGSNQIVINHACRGEQIETFLGDGQRFGARISYSAEGSKPLETGGGIFKALSLLGDDPFIVINSDIWTDYPINQLPTDPVGVAHLVLVDNPPHNSKGDFTLDNGYVRQKGEERYTFSGIGVYRPVLFTNCINGVFPLLPLLQEAIAQNKVTGEYYSGTWIDIGTPDRLYELREKINK